MVQWEVRFIEKFILKINIGKSILVSRQNIDDGNKSEMVKLYLGNGNYQSVYREVYFEPRKMDEVWQIKRK